MNSLICGYGEIGKALNEVLKPYYTISHLDIGSEHIMSSNFDILHICFPYSDNFIKYVKEYQEKYKAKYTVIHSTVPVGTSRQVSAIHSPVRGIHPYLAEGIRTFVKYLGGNESSQVADYFRRAGLKVCLFDKQETTEALKLFDTEYYRHCIEFTKNVKEFCDKKDLNFHEVYTLPNLSYNDGYTELGHPEFVRPVLQPIMTPIGGHCLLNNQKLINE